MIRFRISYFRFLDFNSIATTLIRFKILHDAPDRHFAAHVQQHHASLIVTALGSTHDRCHQPFPCCASERHLVGQSVQFRMRGPEHGSRRSRKAHLKKGLSSHSVAVPKIDYVLYFEYSTTDDFILKNIDTRSQSLNF